MGMRLQKRAWFGGSKWCLSHILGNFVLDPVSIWRPNRNVSANLEFWQNVSKLRF